MKLNKIHHVAVICSDYERSKQFYTDVLGLKVKSEHYRKERDSWKADCYLGDAYIRVVLIPQPTRTSLLSRSRRTASSRLRSRQHSSRCKRTRQ